jgi:uroporphyrinogen III methyltransferase/synthase
MKSGNVYLIGAGPGDPGLITQKGVEYLKTADVIIYDRLLDDRLLSNAKPDAEKIYVGKASSEHTLPQSEINRLMVQKAKAGKNVVRLKGGDPFVFGRGGEEAEELSKNQIAFKIVPGVTSAIAVPAYAGIPVTHRAMSSSFAVITGHEDPTKAESSIQWDKLATAIDTLIFLMGMQNLPEIVSKLIKHGRAADTPVAVVEEGTNPQQKTVIGNLKNIVRLVKETTLSSPAVVVVGEVVKLRNTIRWFDNRPLFGRRILVTRARHQASTLSKILAERGALPVELPAISIQPINNNKELEQAILNLALYQWIIFTSVNGVEAFFNHLRVLKLDSRSLHNLKIAAIGPATGKALEAKGINVDYCPDVFTTEALVTGFQSLNITGQRFLLPRADIADNQLAKRLNRLGAIVQEIAVYRTLPDIEAINKAKEMLLLNHLDVITFTSSSTVSNLITAFGTDSKHLDNVKIACIGPKTAETAIKAGLKPDVVATEHTIPGLVEAVEELFRKEA